MVNRTRSINVLFNSLLGMAATVVSTVMTFAVRTVLSHCLGEELYGVNTLFASIVNTLLIMELGISTAITIYLYEPIVNSDIERIKSIVRVYRNVYRVFCAILVSSGVFVDIFILPRMVVASLPMSKVRVYFLLFLTSVTVKYLWSYKRSLLLADQKNRISTGITAACEVVFGAIEIVVLLMTRDYFFYLALLILQNSFSNYICNTVINHNYPYIIEKKVQPLSKDDKKRIANTVKPMFVQRFAGVVQDSSISVILSFMSESIIAVGFYGNYQLVVHMAQALFSQIGAAFTTSFGNFSVTENVEQCLAIYRKSRFLMNWMAAMISTCFMVLIQMFIGLFFGEQYVLRSVTVFVLTLYLYAYLNNVILVSIQNAKGLHRLDARQMVYQAMLNIILSVCGGSAWGLEGILLGSYISMFVFSTMYKGCTIYEHVFQVKRTEYWKCLINEYARFFVAGGCVLFTMRNILSSVSIIHWLVRAIIAIVEFNIVFALLSIRNSEFYFVKDASCKIIKRIIK